MQDRSPHTPRWNRLSRECHALAPKLDLDHDALSVMAGSRFGVSSWSELGIEELISIRNELRKDVLKADALSESQQGEIFKYGYKILGKDAAWIKDFIRRQTGVRKCVQKLTSAEASKVISGMRAIAGK